MPYSWASLLPETRDFLLKKNGVAELKSPEIFLLKDSGFWKTANPREADSAKGRDLKDRVTLSQPKISQDFHRLCLDTWPLYYISRLSAHLLGEAQINIGELKRG